MTTLKLYGGTPKDAQADAAALLQDLSGTAPEVKAVADDDAKRVDPATALGIATLVLSLPGLVLTGLQIRDLLERRRLVDRLDALKARLEASNTEASLALDTATSLDLRRMPTDDIIEALTKDA